MKYTKDKNKLIQVRLSEEQLKLIDQIASNEKRTRSEILRSFITGGITNDPKIKKITI